VIDVPLAAVPNQTLTIQLLDSIYTITVLATNGVMSISVTRDAAEIIANQRVTPGTPIFPYRYQEQGNFVFSVEQEQLPDYTQFGTTQFLMFLTAQEVAALRGA